MDLKRMAAEEAVKYVRDGMVLGLGTGSTAYHAVNAVGELVRRGYQIQAVATSDATARQAEALGIQLLSIDEVDHIDLDIDGVDEIDPQFNAVKGGGGALFREKIVASLADEVIWIMDERKLVDAIGAFPLAVETPVYGSHQVFMQMKANGWNPELRIREGQKFITDNGNYIIDLHLEKGFDIRAVKECLDLMTGVLEHGLFVNMCTRIAVGTSNGPLVKENPSFIKK